VLGLCFGGQVLSLALGGEVRRAGAPESGWTTLETRDPAVVPPGPWFEWHLDVFSVPPGAVELARSPAGPQAFGLGPHLGLQFHPEVTPETIDRWMSEAPWRLEAAGLDAETVRAETRERSRAAREAAYGLFDRFLEATGSG
jgi:GMP synthase-like glutamine amidotransferase